MGFPDRSERIIEIAYPTATVWAELSTAEGLGAWFGNEVTIELRPGRCGPIVVAGGEKQNMRVERVEQPRVFGFTWHIYGLPDAAPRRPYVELALHPVRAGTRLTVVETGCAQLPDDAHRCASTSVVTRGRAGRDRRPARSGWWGHRR